MQLKRWNFFSNYKTQHSLSRSMRRKEPMGCGLWDSPCRGPCKLTFTFPSFLSLVFRLGRKEQRHRILYQKFLPAWPDPQQRKQHVDNRDHCVVANKGVLASGGKIVRCGLYVVTRVAVKTNKILITLSGVSTSAFDLLVCNRQCKFFALFRTHVALLELCAWYSCFTLVQLHVLT